MIKTEVRKYSSKNCVLRLPHISYHLLSNLISDATKIFSEEPTILKLQSPAVIIGDLHGQILDLFRILKSVGSIDECDKKIIFLGDFVDRGYFSIETITLVLIMKILWSQKVYIVRGNHEFCQVFYAGGFGNEIKSNYPNNCNALISSFNTCFSHIPLAAIIDDFAICLHGGIGPNVKSVSLIEQIEKPVDSFDNDVVAEVLWSDPSEYIQNFHPSTRGMGYLFGYSSLEEFLASYNLSVLIRGHQCVEGGVTSFWNDTCYTVFSASNYCGVTNNNAGILTVLPDKTLTPEIFNPIISISRDDATFFECNDLSKLDLNEIKLPNLVPKIQPRSNIALKKREKINSLQYRSTFMGAKREFNPIQRRKMRNSARGTPDIPGMVFLHSFDSKQD